MIKTIALSIALGAAASAAYGQAADAAKETGKAVVESTKEGADRAKAAVHSGPEKALDKTNEMGFEHDELPAFSRDLRGFSRCGNTLGALLLAASACAALACTASVHAAPANTASPEPAQGRLIDSAADYTVLPSHARVEPENRILTDRLEHLLPALMTESGLDMWVVVNREYAEDPVYFTLVPQPSFAARRTTMLVFSRAADGTVERLAVNRYPLGGPYKSAWSGGDLDAQWKALGALIAGRDPKRIGIDVSRTWPAADGLTHALHERLVEVLPPGYADRLVSAEALVVRWIETRTPAEQAVYPHIDSIARGVIAEAFSSRVITPGVTTTDEVAWYIRERFESLGLRCGSCRRWIVNGPASPVRWAAQVGTVATRDGSRRAMFCTMTWGSAT
jgi:hypothetical protein